MLTDILPAKYRKQVYAIFALAGLVLSAWKLAVEPDPAWVDTALTVLGFVAAAFGATAASNVNAEPARKSDE